MKESKLSLPPLSWLCHGAVTGILEAQSATKEQIGLLMAGETIKKEADAQ